MLAEIFMEKERKAWLGGKKEGKEEGIKESKNEFAKRLLKSGISIENIKDWTGLSEKEINLLSKKITK